VREQRISLSLIDLRTKGNKHAPKRWEIRGSVTFSDELRLNDSANLRQAAGRNKRRINDLRRHGRLCEKKHEVRPATRLTVAKGLGYIAVFNERTHRDDDATPAPVAHAGRFPSPA
jgi:hypothetical protein